jgi:hypothetical protein
MGICDMMEIPPDMTDEDIERRHALWDEIVPASPVSAAEAGRRLAEDPFGKVPPVRGKDAGATLDLARRWAEGQEGIMSKVLLRLMGPEAFELFFAAFPGASLEIPGRDEVLKAARPSMARDAAKAGKGAQKRLAQILDLTAARISQLAQTATRNNEAEITEALEDAALLLEQEKQALLQRAREVLKPSEK